MLIGSLLPTRVLSIPIPNRTESLFNSTKSVTTCINRYTMPSSRSSVTAYSFGPRRYANMAINRQVARQAVIQSRRLAAPSLPIDISRATLNRLAGAVVRRTGEIKTVDIPYNPTGITLDATTTSVTLLNGVASGANFYNRIGNKVNPQSADLDVTIVNNSTTATAWQGVRVALIWDKQPTGAVPVYSDIFQNIDNAGTASSLGFCGRNLQTTDRFVTISHMDQIIPPLNAAVGEGNVRHVKFYKNLAGFQQQFKGATADIGDISSGALYLVLSATSDATNTVTVWSDHRYRYRDN